MKCVAQVRAPSPRRQRFYSVAVRSGFSWWLTASTAALTTFLVYAATHGLGVSDALPWLAAAAGGCVLAGGSWWVAVRLIPEGNRRGWRGQSAIARLIALGVIGWTMVVYGLIVGDFALLGWGLAFAIGCSSAGPLYYRWIMRGGRAS